MITATPLISTYLHPLSLNAALPVSTVARVVRCATLSVREREFVRAAEALGARPLRIMTVHILPNVVGPVIVATTLSVGGIILTESVLSFLGLGIQPPLPSWGNMLPNAPELIWSAPMLAVGPGQIRRASSRGSVWPYALIPVVADTVHHTETQLSMTGNTR